VNLNNDGNCIRIRDYLLKSPRKLVLAHTANYLSRLERRNYNKY
jgi:hypothetical protein